MQTLKNNEIADVETETGTAQTIGIQSSETVAKTKIETEIEIEIATAEDPKNVQPPMNANPNPNPTDAHYQKTTPLMKMIHKMQIHLQSTQFRQMKMNSNTTKSKSRHSLNPISRKWTKNFKIFYMKSPKISASAVKESTK